MLRTKAKKSWNVAHSEAEKSSASPVKTTNSVEFGNRRLQRLSKLFNAVDKVTNRFLPSNVLRQRKTRRTEEDEESCVSQKVRN